MRRKHFQDLLDRSKDESEVVFSHQRLSPLELKTIALALQENTTWRSLDLSHNLLEEEGVKALVGRLRTSNVSTLNLCMCSLRDELLALLASVLQCAPLTQLNLSANSIGREGLESLAAAMKGSRIQSLDLNHNDFGDEGVRALAAVLPACPLTNLSLCGNSIGVEGARFLAFVLKDSPLRSLSLVGNCIQDEGAAYLAAGLKGSSVVSLDLSGNGIGEKGGEFLLEGLPFSDVTELQLCRCSNQTFSTKTLSQIKEVLETNRETSLCLLMKVQGLEKELRLIFHSTEGKVVADLPWSLDRPIQGLPRAVLTELRNLEGLRPENLRLLLPDGKVLDVGLSASHLAQQLGISNDFAVETSEVQRCAKRPRA